MQLFFVHRVVVMRVSLTRDFRCTREAIMERYITILVCVVGLLVSPCSLEARDYITQSQLEQSTVVDLPGRIGADFVRERDAENMTANAISRVSSLLSSYTGITLGTVGGLATLGFLGVISTPVAVVGAALVGGLAIIGASTDQRAPMGLSQPNYGHMGHGRAPVYGVQPNETGIVSEVFGWSNPHRNSRYNIGSLGISSSMRAPVRVNMQSPHVLNTAFRGFNFDHYDSGYQNMPVNPLTGQLGMAVSPVAGVAGVPYAPNSSVDSEKSQQSSPSAPISHGFGTSWNYPFYPGQSSRMPQTHYDRRSGNTFNNFFSRVDRPGILSGDRGTRADRGGYRHFWAGPSPYSHNWAQTRNAPGTYISQSWEYQQAGQWRPGSPQGRVSHGWGYSPNPNATSGQPGSGSSTTQYVTQSGASGLLPGNPMDFRFRRPSQSYEVGLNFTYPMGNAYSNPAVPGNYQANFTITNQQINQGYQPNFQNVDGGLQYGLGTQYQGGNYPYQSGNTPPQIQNNWVGQAPVSNGLRAPSDPIRPIAPRINSNVNPELAQQSAEAHEAAQKNIINNQTQALGAAMSPDSSKVDFLRLTELEEERQDVYADLLNAVKVGDEAKQKLLFDKYQALGQEIQSLR